jgi:hypothetical protein
MGLKCDPIDPGMFRHSFDSGKYYAPGRRNFTPTGLSTLPGGLFSAS